MQQQNKNLPVEYESIINMVQKESSIKQGLTALKSKILVSAGEEFLSWPKEKQENFFERTVIAIAKDENLKKCFESTEGKLSIIEAIEKSISTALTIGGQHAYLVPQGRTVNKNGQDYFVTEVRFSIRDRGYHALLCGGKRPIFKDLRWGKVYKKEVESGLVKINTGTGEVEHNQYLLEDAGDLVGVWVQAIKMNGQKEVQYFLMKKINQWRDSSRAYKDAVKKGYDTIWTTWPEEMALQASIRHFCERYEQARELLASAIYDDEEIETEQKSPVEKIDQALIESKEERKKKLDEELKQAEIDKKKANAEPEESKLKDEQEQIDLDIF